MSIFSRKVRDYVRAKEGKSFLQEHFSFSAFSQPSLGEGLVFPEGADTNVVGTAFDKLLPLLVFRANKKIIDTTMLAFSWLPPKERREFVRSGNFSDTILNQAIQSAIASHKRFTWRTPAARSRPNQQARQALRSLLQRADSLAWHATQISNHVALSEFGVVDLVLDETAIEIKAVKDVGHHSEHTAQLLAYFLLAQLPAVRDCAIIKRIGVYYARHGVLTTISVSELCHSSLDMAALAADFYETFIRWTVEKQCRGYQPQLKAKFLEQQLRLGLYAAGLASGRIIR